MADRRGLTAMGAATVSITIGLIGAIIDVNTGSGLRTTFSVCFVLGSVVGALLAHREDLRATVVMPPLVYGALAFLGAVLGQSGVAGSFLTRNGLEMTSQLVLGAPTLFLGTGLAFAIAFVRRWTARPAPTASARP